MTKKKDPLSPLGVCLVTIKNLEITENHLPQMKRSSSSPGRFLFSLLMLNFRSKVATQTKFDFMARDKITALTDEGMEKINQAILRA